MSDKLFWRPNNEDFDDPDFNKKRAAWEEKVKEQELDPDIEKSSKEAYDSYVAKYKDPVPDKKGWVPRDSDNFFKDKLVFRLPVEVSQPSWEFPVPLFPTYETNYEQALEDDHDYYLQFVPSGKINKAYYDTYSFPKNEPIPWTQGPTEIKSSGKTHNVVDCYYMEFVPAHYKVVFVSRAKADAASKSGRCIWPPRRHPNWITDQRICEYRKKENGTDSEYGPSLKIYTLNTYSKRPHAYGTSLGFTHDWEAVDHLKNNIDKTGNYRITKKKPFWHYSNPDLLRTGIEAPMLAARVAKNLRLNFGGLNGIKNGNKNGTKKNVVKVGKNNVERGNRQVALPFNSGLSTYSYANNRQVALPFNSGVGSYSYANSGQSSQNGSVSVSYSGLNWSAPQNGVVPYQAPGANSSRNGPHAVGSYQAPRTNSIINDPTGVVPYQAPVANSSRNGPHAVGPYQAPNRVAVISELDSIYQQSRKDPTVVALVAIARQVAEAMPPKAWPMFLPGHFEAEVALAAINLAGLAKIADGGTKALVLIGVEGPAGGAGRLVEAARAVAPMLIGAAAAAHGLVDVQKGLELILRNPPSPQGLMAHILMGAAAAIDGFADIKKGSEAADRLLVRMGLAPPQTAITPPQMAIAPPPAKAVSTEPAKDLVAAQVLIAAAPAAAAGINIIKAGLDAAARLNQELEARKGIWAPEVKVLQDAAVGNLAKAGKVVGDLGKGLAAAKGLPPGEALGKFGDVLGEAFGGLKDIKNGIALAAAHAALKWAGCGGGRGGGGSPCGGKGAAAANAAIDSANKGLVAADKGLAAGVVRAAKDVGAAAFKAGVAGAAAAGEARVGFHQFVERKVQKLDESSEPLWGLEWVKGVGIMGLFLVDQGLHAGTQWGRGLHKAIKANMNRAKAKAGGGGSTNEDLSAIADKLRAAARLIANERKTPKSNEKKNNRRTRKN